MDFRKIYENIRTFLFSNMNKEFLVFLFFLILSGAFWLMMTLNETYEYEIKVPVHIKGVPRNVVLTSEPIDTISVTVRDKGWFIMAYLYTEKPKPITIPFKNYDRGNGRGAIPLADMKRSLEQELEVSTTIVSVKPERYQFYYNNGQRKRVPVRWTGRVIPDQLFFISNTIYTPDSVDIYSSKEKLDSIQAVYTEPLNLVNFRDTLNITCDVAHADDVKVDPEQIQIQFFTDVLTEETMINIPIQCINLPENMVLRTFPPKAKVHFVAGATQIKALRPEDFIVIVDYREIEQKQQDKCTLYLRHVPHGVSRATLETHRVDYLLEEK